MYSFISLSSYKKKFIIFSDKNLDFGPFSFETNFIVSWLLSNISINVEKMYYRNTWLSFCIFKVQKSNVNILNFLLREIKDHPIN